MMSIVERPWRRPVVHPARALTTRRYRSAERRRIPVAGVPLLVVQELNTYLLLEKIARGAGP